MSNNFIFVNYNTDGSTENLGAPLMSSCYGEDIMDRLSQKTGPLRFTLRNDRMFHGIFSSSAEALAALASIFTGIPKNKIIRVRIENPISFGRPFTANAKKTTEDLRMIVNDSTQVDVEMQNIFASENNMRFLLYVCRDYSRIIKMGEEYDQLIRTIGSVIMNYNTDDPCFYGRYHLYNEKTAQYFLKNPDFFEINVLQIKRLGLATPEDKEFKRDILARLLLSDTWEELRNLSEEDEFAKEVVLYMYHASADDLEAAQLELAQRELEKSLSNEHKYRRAEREAAEARAGEARAKAGEARAKEEAAREKENARRLQDELAASNRDKEEKDKYIADLEARLSAFEEKESGEKK